jgi:uncharacterized protein involved in outer membrane biogenesis
VALIVIAVAIFIALFQWNWLRGPVGAYASERLHRPVAIHGDMSGRLLTWTPSATAQDVTVGQPGWAGGGQMAVIPRLTLAVDLHDLLRGRLVLALADAERPTVRMIRDATGRNNWTFAPAGAAPQPLKLPPIRRFTIEDGHLTLDDARRRLHFAGTVTSNERLTGYGRGRFSLTGQGDLNGAPFLAQITGGPLINVDPDRPYPFHSDIRAGATHILAQGAITRPFDLGDFQAAGQVSGEDMASLYGLTGLALPSSPPYALTGDLKRRGPRFDVTDLHGRVGVSDVEGRLTVTEGSGRKDLTGDLASRRLKLADLTAMIGGAPRGALKGTVVSPAQAKVADRLTAEGRILPDSPLNVARMRQMDADVRYRAETVDAGPAPIRQVRIRARLDHGLLTVDPLALTLPQGALSGRVRLDGRGATPQAAVDLTLAGAQVQELLPRRAGAPALTGPLSAHARLAGAGDSLRAVAANANGVLAVVIPGGQMRQLLAELMGIDATKSLFLYLARDQTPTPVRCAVAQFDARGGVLTARRLIIDTGAVRAEGGGTIDMRNETVNLALSGKPKHFRLIRIAAPITLKGGWGHPKIGVDLEKAAPQVGLGVVLGALVSPLAAVLPFISGGTAKDADCAALTHEAAAAGAPL